MLHRRAVHGEHPGVVAGVLKQQAVHGFQRMGGFQGFPLKTHPADSAVPRGGYHLACGGGGFRKIGPVLQAQGRHQVFPVGLQGEKGLVRPAENGCRHKARPFAEF